MYGDALTTKERIKDRLGILVTTWDDVFDSFILSITSRIEQMCGRRFIKAEFTNELHDGSDPMGSIRTTLIVKNAPIQAVASIQYKAGTSSSPDWTDFYADDYVVDYNAGIIHFPNGIPRGMQNLRLTYTGGFSGHSIGISSLWHFNVTPTGTVDGSNLSFTLPENADQVVVYADGAREPSANITHTDGTDTFAFAAGRAPYTTVAVDYKGTAAGSDGDITLPEDLVDVAERSVVKLFKRRESEGRSSETFQESSITWEKSIFTDEDLRTIRNYRRGYSL